MAQPAVCFEHVTKRYGDTLVLDDFSLEVPEGEFLAMIGRSGCGKTTALKLVNGLLAPDAGRVLVNGQDVAGTDPIALRRGIGYAIQSVGLFPHLTVGKNIAYVPSLTRMWGKAREQAEVARLLGVVGLPPELAGRYPAELSGGQKQRVGIARALAASPRLLLMDEPFGAVDEITRRALQDELAALHRRLGLTVLFVTHDIGEALKLGGRVLVMEAGRIAQCAPPAQVCRAPASPSVRERVGGRTPRQ